MRLGKVRRVRRHERQIALVRELDQRAFRCIFDRIAAPRELDVEPPGEQGLEPVELGLGMIPLAVGEQPRQRAFARPGECDQTLGAPFQVGGRDMRFEFERPVEMRLADEVAEVVVPRLVLRIERQVIDLLALRIPRHPEQRADDRLHALVHARLGEHDRAVEPVAITDRDCWKAALLGQLGDRLGVDRPFEHRIRRQHAQGNERGKWHGCNMRTETGFAKVECRCFPLFVAGSTVVRYFPFPNLCHPSESWDRWQQAPTVR